MQPSGPVVYTVPEFINAHKISRAVFYKLLKLGLGPKLMKVGARTLITAESAQEWRFRMESLTAERGQVA
jgi:hypothetical protein